MLDGPGQCNFELSTPLTNSVKNEDASDDIINRPGSASDARPMGLEVNAVSRRAFLRRREGRRRKGSHQREENALKVTTPS